MIDLQTAKRIQMTATCPGCGEVVQVQEYFTDKYGTNYRGICMPCDIDIRVATRVQGHLYSGLQKMIEQRKNEKQVTPQIGKNKSRPRHSVSPADHIQPGGKVACFGDRR